MELNVSTSISAAPRAVGVNQKHSDFRQRYRSKSTQQLKKQVPKEDKKQVHPTVEPLKGKPQTQEKQEVKTSSEHVKPKSSPAPQKTEITKDQVSQEESKKKTSSQVTRSENSRVSSMMAPVLPIKEKIVVEPSKQEIEFSGSGSRRHPARLADNSFMQHHLDAVALSAGSLLLPQSSSSSDDIFKCASDDSFEALGIHSKLISVIRAPRSEGGLGLAKPTRVQSVAIGHILTGRNTYIKSQTGSGKTLAYLLPLIHRLGELTVKPNRQDGTYALILAPTRELCSQINDVLNRLIQRYIWLVPGIICGGEKRKSEKNRLRKGVTVLVATPGRLLDHLKSTEAFRHDRLQYLILDEVDRLMDMGFEKQVKEILDILSRLRRTQQAPQTTLASATVTDAVQALLSEHLGDHLLVDADQDQQPDTAPPSTALSSSAPNKFNTPTQLVQHSMSVTYKLRLCALCSVLRNCWMKKNKVVLFVSTTASCDFFEALFASAIWPGETNFGATRPQSTSSLFDGWPLHRLHGNIPQSERQATFNAFRPLKSGLLVATDVAARGLDMPEVDFVIQYDAPAEISDYVHRIGRTARKGAPGTALLFLSPNENDFLGHLSSRGLVLTPLSLESAFKRAFEKQTSARGTGGRECTSQFLHEHLQGVVEQHTRGDGTVLKDMALAAFQAFVRAYSTHSGESRHVFQVRQLHLGHVARSFALQSAPKAIKHIAPGNKGMLAEQKKQPGHEQRLMATGLKRKRKTGFADGI